MENDTQRLALENAHLALESKCMARYGFTTPSQVSRPAPAPGFDASNMQRRYGVSDPGLAQKYGYHLSTPLPTANPTGELLSPESKEVLSGRTRDASGAFVAVSKFAGQAVPPGGCFGAASREIGDVDMDTSLPERLDAESLDRSTADPRVQAALSKWSQCMAGKAYHAASPETMDQVVPYTTTPAATQTEIQIAMADVNCKKSTGLIATWFAVETGIQNTMVDQHQLALNAERQRLNAAIKKAASLVG